MRVQERLQIRLITHNIRYATTHPSRGEEEWSIRRPHVASELRFTAAHNQEAFICLQEVLHEQLIHVLSDLNTANHEWCYIGVGRDDGKEAGEYSPIFYRPAAWELIENKTIWLSETPERPSKGWDAASIRILTIGHFQNRRTRKHIIAMNTHLDDRGGKSRLESVKIIAEEIRTMSDHAEEPGLPVFLAGDLNSETNMEAYVFLKEHSPMADVQDMISPDSRYGHQGTFTGFGHEPSPPTRIDFLFVNRSISEIVNSTREDKNWIANNYGILENRFDDGIYLSDHRAVVADLSLNL